MNSTRSLTHRAGLRSCLGLLASVFLFGSAAAGPPVAARDIPYLGEVAGTVVSGLDLQHPTAGAVVRSHPLGPGTQVFEDLSLGVRETDGWTWLDTAGIGVTTTASRNELRIRFALHGVFVGPTTVVYTGTFEVISGGTGPFEFSGMSGGLGTGLIEGWAELTPDLVSGTLEFRFRHFFQGTLCAIGEAVRSSASRGSGGR